MRQGTIAVREVLQEASGHITDKQIQEALWHYYYDVDKSVAYLVTTYMVGAQKTHKKAAAKKVQGGLFSFGSMRDAGACVCGGQSSFVGGGF
jgi:hypothetical protein